MKDTIRLKQSNKAALEATGYNDANEAIAEVLKERDSLKDQLKVKLTLQSATKELQNATGNVTKCNGWKPDAAYWAQFRDEVRESMKSPKLPGLVPASTLKTIGKIEPEERLEEPSGKQGRDIR